MVTTALVPAAQRPTLQSELRALLERHVADNSDNAEEMALARHIVKSVQTFTGTPKASLPAPEVPLVRAIRPAASELRLHEDDARIEQIKAGFPALPEKQAHTLANLIEAGWRTIESNPSGFIQVTRGVVERGYIRTDGVFRTS